MREPGTSPAARVIAVGGLIAAFILVIVVVATSGGGSSGGSPTARAHTSSGAARANDPAVKRALLTGYYRVRQGDTLDSIALATGVGVTTLQQLNPALDPQRLLTGSKIKLR
jgi:LysM repeat protein